MTEIQIEIKGLERLQAAFRKFPSKVARNMGMAGKEAADEILDTEGLRNYPPETAANLPPTPFYIRGRGTQTSTGHNTGTSERLGSQWNIRQGWSTVIGNRASYAKYVHGEEQAKAMGAKGWRKLLEVGKEKIVPVTKIYNRWVKYTLGKLGL